MVGEVSRVAASVVALPVSLAMRGLQAAMTGSTAILDVQVRHWEDALLRQYVLQRLRRAATDPRVGGVLLRFEAPPGSWASCQDFRHAIQRLRNAGRGVYAYLEHPGNALVWLASACDRVFLVPTGEVALVGVGAELTFFGSALQRLGIEPDFEAAGAYKSFGEPYTRTFASPENHEAILALCGDLHEQLLQGIATGRGIAIEDLRELIARAPLSPREALEGKLVDQLAYEDEVEAWIREHHGGSVRRVSFEPWARLDGAVAWVERWGDPSEVVAVLHLDGPIVMDDKGPAMMVRARRVIPQLRAYREDEKVRAVVLHINSPGGSALASDLIWREVERLQRVKPVVACFEDVAASGGYYLAAPATEIVARRGTLTGSIGVFGGKLVMREGLRRLGVHTQEVKAAPNANLYSVSKPFTPDQRARFRASLERFYEGFVQRVAAGRRRPAEALEPHCRGRVWTGQAAHERGLVDRYGDLYDAVDRARALAGLHVGAYRRLDRNVQPQASILARLVHSVMRQVMPAGARSVERLSGGLARLVLGMVPGAALEVLLDNPEQPMAMLPFDLKIR